MTDIHRVFLEPRFVLRCASCGAEYQPDDIGKAQHHVLNGGPKVLASASEMYPCIVLGCGRTFASEQGLAVHAARKHANG
jgi:hypothetical protein